MAKKPLDRAAKEKRQKIILVVGGVLLLGLVAIQGPKTMKMLNAKPPADESHGTTTTTSSTDTAITAAPTGPGGIVTATATGTATVAPTAQATAVVTPGGIGIANTTVAAAADAGQFVSFSRFKSKDPFVQQVAAAGSAPAASATTPASTPATATAPATSAVPTQTPATAPSTPQTNVVPVTPAAPAPKPTSAEIAVDGIVETVAVKASFPKANPTFTLVSLTKTGARIGIVGGSYSGGDATVTLKRGKTLTLENTADGSRYKLRLVSVT